MGVLGDSMVAYAQALIYQTDGSPTQVQNALTISTLCWNLAIQPDAVHDEFLSGMRESLKMDDEEFREFRLDVITPMIQRHRDMFPGLNPKRKQIVSNLDPDL